MLRPSGDSEWALLLSPESPYPTAGGGAIRTASVLEFLSQRFRVHLVAFALHGDEEHAPPDGIVERLDWIRLPRHSQSLAARGWRNASRLLRGVLPLVDRFSAPSSREQLAHAIGDRGYALAVIEHFWCAPYVDMLRAQSRGIVLNLHNVESALAAGCARTEAWPARWAHAAFARVAERAERELLPKFDLVLAASEVDQRRVSQAAPQACAAVYPNAIRQQVAPQAPEEHCIAFSGNLGYHPNVTAVRYFARELWPEIRKRDPRLRWRLIGKNEHAVQDLVAGVEGIEVTGAVEDAVRELARAKVVVVPLLAGSGTRIKILEAWAAARAVVSTTLGAEGLPVIEGQDILLADRPAQMIEAVCRLLRDEDLRKRLGQAGRRLLEERFSWPAAWEQLEQSLAVWLPGVPARIEKHP